MFLRIGHRGARAYEVENTLESFEKAIGLGANAIELDVRRSKDGKQVVIHDDSLKRVFGSDTLVNGATLEHLQSLTGGRVPSLEEALRFIGTRVRKVIVELKEPGSERDVLDIVGREKLEDRVIIASFHESALESVRRLDRKIETGFIYAQPRNPVDTALKLGAQYLIALYRFVRRRDVEKAHLNGLKVIVWTINTQQEAREYIARGVDGIASDRPDVLG